MTATSYDKMASDIPEQEEKKSTAVSGLFNALSVVILNRVPESAKIKKSNKLRGIYLKKSRLFSDLAENL